MSTCPNKNTQQYKDLVKQLGSEEAAIFTWKMYKGNFPEEMDLDVLKSKMDIKDSMPFSSLSSMVSSVKKYNLENNTSHSISIKKDQHSDNYIVSLIPSYVNVDNLSKLKKLLDDNNIDNDINLSRQGINDLYSKEDSMFANNVFKTDFVVPRKIEDVIQIKEDVNISINRNKFLNDDQFEKFAQAKLQDLKSNPEFIQESIEKVLEQTGVKDVEDVVEFVDNISRNISNRLGITLEEYYRKNKYKYIKDPISNKEAIRLLELSSGGNLNPNDSQVTVLNQPNQNLEKSFIESPISKKLGLDINNDEHKWIFRFVTTTKIGKELLGRLGNNPNLQDLNKVIQEEFNLIKERAKSTDDYYLTELTDSYIDSQIADAKAEANSENQSMWESIKDNPKEYIEEQNKLQKSNLIGILEYYTTAHEYPLGMKMTIIDNLLNNDYSYDFRTKKYSKKVRYKNTIGLHFNPSSLFMNKVIPHALSQNAVMDDYFYEAANFKGENLDFSKYKNNIHQVTNEGTWYYFTKDKVGDNELFHKMSALSSLHKGSWCTGGTQETADGYLERGDMYIFYSNRDNLPTVQLHVNNNKAIEIGGTLEGQGLHEEDIETVEDFQRTNPKIDLQKVRDYTRYSKILKKWNKANRDNSVLTKEEKKILLFAEKYYKDRTTNLEDFKESLSNKDYAEIFEVKESDIYKSDEYIKFLENGSINENAIIIGGFNLTKELTLKLFPDRNLNKKLFKHSTGRVSLSHIEKISHKAFDSAGVYVDMSSLTTLTTKAFDSAGGSVDMSSLRTLTSKAFDSAGWSVDMRSLTTLTSKAFDSAVGDVIMSSLTTLTTKAFDSAGGSVDMSSLRTLTSKAFDSAGWSVDMRSLTTLTSKAFDSAGGRIYMSSLTTLTTKAFDTAGGSVNMLSLTTISKNAIKSLILNSTYDNIQHSYSEDFKNKIENSERLSNLLDLLIGTEEQIYSFYSWFLNSKNLEFADITLEENTDLLNEFFNKYNTIQHSYNVELNENEVGKKEFDPYGEENKTLNQDNRGTIVLGSNNTSLTVFNKNSDITTIIHEKAHEFERVLTEDEIKVLEEWSKFKHGTTEFSEAFAKGAEKVLYDGTFGNEKVDNIFSKFKEWFKKIITDAINYFSDLNEMNQDVLNIYRKMMIGEMEETSEQIHILGGKQDVEGFKDFVQNNKKDNSQDEITSIIQKAKADGTYMKAPNGKPTNLSEQQWLQVRTKAFKEWFGDWENDIENSSKVIDENGEPLVVYHGTDSYFEEFIKNKISTGADNGSIGDLGEGFYFAKDKKIAEIFSLYLLERRKNNPDIKELRDKKLIEYLEKNSSETPIVMSAFLNVRILEDINDLQTNDSFTSDVGGRFYSGSHYEIVVNSPNQIKSATDNIGTFDNNNNNILFQSINRESSLKLRSLYGNKILIDEAAEILVGQLQKTGLATKVHQFTTEEINQKLEELGISEDIRKQVLAWHGSPHLFQKFSTVFMGTGEGVQAFGWGLYFTDLESIARNYANMRIDLTVDSLIGVFDKTIKNFEPTQYFVDYLLNNHSFTKDFLEIYERFESDVTKTKTITEKLNFLKEEGWISINPLDYSTVGLSLFDNLDVDGIISRLEDTGFYKEDDLNTLENELNTHIISRNLYKVTLHKGKTPDQYTWLEWDKPAHDKIYQLLKNKLPSNTKLFNMYLQGYGAKGNNIYHLVARELGGDKQASLFLLENGIDGIKFPAESIFRGATSDNARGFNYVVFDENAITIEEHIQFQKKLNEQGIQLTPTGFVHNTEVFINKDTATLDTPIHEFAHLYNKKLKQDNPELYKRGVDLVMEELEKIGLKSTEQSTEELSDLRKQIAGEKGARALDIIEKTTKRIDALKKAREMEDKGLSPIEIRLATGWERGIDKLWRYEVDDFNLKVNNVYSQKYKLSDLIEAPILFSMYPAIADIIVRVDISSIKKLQGYYNHSKREIGVTARDNKDILTILIHEVQHAIQKEEGFAEGGTVPILKTERNERLKNLAFKLPDLSREDRRVIKDAFRKNGLGFSTVFLFDVQKDDVYLLEDILEKLEIIHSIFPNDAYIELINAVDEKIEYLLNTSDEIAYDKYLKIAGEVEARNVTKRLGLTKEQRLNTLLSETEDVDRKDQEIIISSISEIENIMSHVGKNDKEPTLKNLQSIINKNNERIEDAKYQLRRLADGSVDAKIKKHKKDIETLLNIYDEDSWKVEEIFNDVKQELLGITGVDELLDIISNSRKAILDAQKQIDDINSLDNEIEDLKRKYKELTGKDYPSFQKESRNETKSDIQSIIDYVRQTQPELQGEALAEEILAQLVGERGVKLLEEAGDKKSGILAWLKEAFEAIKKMLGLSDMPTSKAMNLSLEEYADAIAVDLLKSNDNSSLNKRYTKEELSGIKLAGPLFESLYDVINPIRESSKLDQDDAVDIQEEAIEEWAKENNVWHENADEEFKNSGLEYIGEGQESIVYRKGDNVIKLTTTNNYRDYQDFLDSIIARNTIFPNSAVKILGAGTITKQGEKGWVSIIVQQPLIENAEEATKEDIDNLVKDLGLKKANEEENRYYNEDYVFTDLAPRNILKNKEGEIFFIDPIIHLNTDRWNLGGTREQDESDIDESAFNKRETLDDEVIDKEEPTSLDDFSAFFQDKEGTKMGAFDAARSVIYALTNPDITTFPHELGHVFLESIIKRGEKEKIETIISWYNEQSNSHLSTDLESLSEEEQRTIHEAFADGFVLYLAEGNTTNNEELNNIFDQFSKWLADMLDMLKQSLGFELNDAMRDIYANMLGSENVKLDVKETIADNLGLKNIYDDFNSTPYSFKTESSNNNDNVQTTEYSIYKDGKRIGYYYISYTNQGTAYIEDFDLEEGVDESEYKAVFKFATKHILNQKLNPVTKPTLDKSEYEFLESLHKEGFLDSNKVPRNKTVGDKKQVDYSKRKPFVYKIYETVEEQEEEVTLKQEPVIKNIPTNVENISIIEKTKRNKKHRYIINDDTGDIIAEVIRGVVMNDEFYETKEDAAKTLLGVDSLDGLNVEYHQAKDKKYSIKLNGEIKGSFYTGYIVNTLEKDIYYEDDMDGREDMLFDLKEKLNTSKEKEETPAYALIRVQGANGEIQEVARFVEERKNGKKIYQNVYGERFEITDENIISEASFDQFKKQPQENPTIEYDSGDTIEFSDPNMGIKREATVKDVSVKRMLDGSFIVTYGTTKGNVDSKDIIGKVKETEEMTMVKDSELHKAATTAAQNIATQFDRVFGGQIPFKIGYYNFNALARVHKGVVEININHIVRENKTAQINEIVAHEFMHPFVKALYISNKELYDRLLEELKSSKEYSKLLKEVEDSINEEGEASVYHDITEQDMDEELLTRYLGKKIGEAFDSKTGRLVEKDVTKLKTSTVFGQFFKWLSNIIDVLLGKKSYRKLDSLQKDINGIKEDKFLNITIARDLQENVTAIVKDNGNIELVLDRSLENYGQSYLYLIETSIRNNEDLTREQQDKIINTLRESYYIKNNSFREGKSVSIGELNPLMKLNDIVDFMTLQLQTPLVEKSIQQLNREKFNEEQWEEQEIESEKVNKKTVYRQAYTNRGYTVIFDKGSSRAKNKYEDFVIIDPNGNEILDSDVFPNSFNKENAEISSVLNLLGAYISKNNPTQESQDRDKQLDMLRKINDLTGVKLKFDSNAMNVISQMTAHMAVSSKFYQTKRGMIVKKLELLQSVAKNYKDSRLQTEYNVINKLNNTISNDEDFIREYANSAVLSLGMAYSKYFELIDDMKKFRGTMTKEMLNQINKEFISIRQLLAFHDQFDSIVQSAYSETDSMYAKYMARTSYISIIKNGMENATIDLITEWLEPYAEAHNKFMKEQGYDGEEYMIDRKLIRNHFRYGLGEEVGYVSYWLGSNVTSKNMINALVANTINKSLMATNVDIHDHSMDINVAFRQFLKDKGLNNITSDSKVAYYKKHYLRKAITKVRRYDDVLDEYVENYEEKWALHQPFYWDLFQKDLDAYIESLGEPKTEAEEVERDEKINKWREAQGYTLDKSGKPILTNPKYINREYEKLKDDAFFKVLEEKYNIANEKYGHNRLRYGIVPQKYDDNFFNKIRVMTNKVYSEENVKKQIDKLKEEVSKRYIFQQDKDTFQNLDDSTHRRLSTTLTTSKEEENLDLTLNETITDFVGESFRYEALQDTQYVAENLIVLLQGNATFGIEERGVHQKDVVGNVFRKNRYEKAKKEMKAMEKMRDAGETIDEDRYDKLKELVDKGVVEKAVKDPRTGDNIKVLNSRANKMLIAQIQDVYFGKGVEDQNIKWLNNVSAKKLANHLSTYESILRMGGNVLAATTNIGQGNLEMFLEAHSGKFYKKRHLAKATADYIKNIPTYFADFGKPIKSKDNQLAIMLDAIQGEIQDEFGKRVTGSLASKILSSRSFFFLMGMGEHQLQLTNMKAMLLAKMVTTKTGEKISLYDAYVADSNGRYSLRKDLVDFNEEDLFRFMRQLQGVNRKLNGNYSEFNKTMVQRQWFGNLIMKFRKWMYPTFRSRWGDERVDYETNTVEIGSYTFLLRYLKNSALQLFNAEVEFDRKNLKPHEKAALRRATMEIGVYIGIMLLALLMFGGGDDDQKELNSVEKFVLLSMVRVHSGLEIYNGGIPSVITAVIPGVPFKFPNPITEPMKILRSPSSSVNTIAQFMKVLNQLGAPEETYKQSGPGYKKGESKLWLNVRKLLPFKQFLDLIEGRFTGTMDNQLGYYNMINKGIKGINPKQDRM